MVTSSPLKLTPIRLLRNSAKCFFICLSFCETWNCRLNLATTIMRIIRHDTGKTVLVKSIITYAHTLPHVRHLIVLLINTIRHKGKWNPSTSPYYMQATLAVLTYPMVSSIQSADKNVHIFIRLGSQIKKHF